MVSLGIPQSAPRGPVKKSRIDEVGRYFAFSNIALPGVVFGLVSKVPLGHFTGDQRGPFNAIVCGPYLGIRSSTAGSPLFHSWLRLPSEAHGLFSGMP